MCWLNFILVRHPDTCPETLLLRMFQVGIFTKHASERCRTRAFRHDVQECRTPAGQNEPPPSRSISSNPRSPAPPRPNEFDFVHSKAEIRKTRRTGSGPGIASVANHDSNA